MKDYNKIDDNELIVLIRNGDEEAKNMIYVKYKDKIEYIAKSYYINDYAYDNDDIIQILCIGFTKALNRFDPECGTLFSSYYKKCLISAITDAIRAVNTQKFTDMTTEYLSSPVNIDDKYILSDVIVNIKSDMPEDSLINKENIKKLTCLGLNKAELKVLLYRGQGKSYAEISEDLGFDSNAISHILKKAKEKYHSIQ